MGRHLLRVASPCEPGLAGCGCPSVVFQLPAPRIGTQGVQARQMPRRGGGLNRITNCYILDLVKLISNKALREFASLYPNSDAPLQAFRVRVEKGVYRNFAELKATFRGVDKVGERYVFNIGGNKYRVIAGIAFSVQMLWVKAVLTHAQYDEGDWK